MFVVDVADAPFIVTAAQQAAVVRFRHFDDLCIRLFSLNSWRRKQSVKAYQQRGR